MPSIAAKNLSNGDRMYGDRRCRVMSDATSEGMIPGIVSVELWPLEGGSVFRTEYEENESVYVIRPHAWSDGDLAYYASSFGLVPCKVVGVRTHNWASPGPKSYVVVKLTANRGWFGFDVDNKPAYSYKRGDLYQVEISNGTQASKLVSRENRFVSGGRENWTDISHDFSSLPDVSESLDRHSIRNW